MNTYAFATPSKLAALKAYVSMVLRHLEEQPRG